MSNVELLPRHVLYLSQQPSRVHGALFRKDTKSAYTSADSSLGVAVTQLLHKKERVYVDTIGDMRNPTQTGELQRVALVNRFFHLCGAILFKTETHIPKRLQNFLI